MFAISTVLSPLLPTNKAVLPERTLPQSQSRDAFLSPRSQSRFGATEAAKSIKPSLNQTIRQALWKSLSIGIRPGENWEKLLSNEKTADLSLDKLSLSPLHAHGPHAMWTTVLATQLRTKFDPEKTEQKVRPDLYPLEDPTMAAVVRGMVVRNTKDTQTVHPIDLTQPTLQSDEEKPGFHTQVISYQADGAHKPTPVGFMTTAPVWDGAKSKHLVVMTRPFPGFQHDQLMKMALSKEVAAQAVEGKHQDMLVFADGGDEALHRAIDDLGQKPGVHKHAYGGDEGGPIPQKYKALHQKFNPTGFTKTLYEFHLSPLTRRAKSLEGDASEKQKALASWLMEPQSQPES